MRERWFGATGRRVPEIAVEGEDIVLRDETRAEVDGQLYDVLLVSLPLSDERLSEAHAEGVPVVVRASTTEQVQDALSRPEVACAAIPAAVRGLRELDLTELTYGPVADQPVSTYSIVACDLDAGQWGVAVQSKFLAVGSVVPWAEPLVGAIATQAYANPRYGPEGLELLRGGLQAAEVVERLTAADGGRGQRQVGIVDGKGGSATYTGSDCHTWAGGRTGHCYAAQGNILVSGKTVEALAATFESAAGTRLANRLLDCLAAAQAAGGDSRGQQSASLLIVEKDGGYAGLSDLLVDLRVDDHAHPIEELRRLYGLHDALFGKTPDGEWLDLDDALARELRERLGRLGFNGELDEALSSWAGKENLEERIDGVQRIDPVVLAELRRQS